MVQVLAALVVHDDVCDDVCDDDEDRDDDRPLVLHRKPMSQALGRRKRQQSELESSWSLPCEEIIYTLRRH
jgi:hypothetical protein